jgi:hypothetical protein
MCFACAAPPELKPAPAPPGPGLTFTWPRDGQLDVPHRAPVVLHFSDAIAAGLLDAGCPTLCVESARGATAGRFELVAPDTVVFSPAADFEDSVEYRVRIAQAVLPAATNLTVDPRLHFTARQTRPKAGAPAQVLAFNDEPPDAGTRPFLDVAPLRLLFSEPLDPASVTATTVTLSGGAGAVAVACTTGGAQLVVDPLADLQPGVPWTLRVDGVRDLGGEAVPPFTLVVTPVRAALPDGLLSQVLVLDPPWTGLSAPSSALSGAAVNASLATSPLIGNATLGVRGGSLRAELGDPSAFGGPIPLVLRRGQYFELSPLLVRLGGVVESGYQTGDLRLTILGDAVGFLSRNPLRPPSQLPDDARSPVLVDLTFDAVLTAADPQGNALATQTLMGLRLLGTSTADGAQLVIDQVSAIDFSTLGIGIAPTTMALRLRTGGVAATPAPVTPRLTAVFPPGGQAVPDSSFHFLFDAPLPPEGLALQLTENGVALAAGVRSSGSSLIVSPARRLLEGATVRLSGGPLPAPQSFIVRASTPTAEPPKLASVTVGAPCALTRTSATSGGACAGGQPGDTAYLRSELPANRVLRVGFTQAMRPITLGASCGTGAVRVERLDAAGACAAVVPGTLAMADRAFTFTPNQPWVVGTDYRLMLVAGNNVACGPDEVCSRSAVPLDTDPLTGGAGGPDVVLRFAATAPTPDSAQPLASEPLGDVNGNGALDGAETLPAENRVAMEVAGTSGIVTSASLNGADCVAARGGQQSCSALQTDLPVVVGALLARCPIDATGALTASGGPCLQVRVLPNVIYGTALSMNTRAIGVLPIDNLSTGEMVMRVREGGAPAMGYIMAEAGQAHPQFVIRQGVWLDTPSLLILGGLVAHDLVSKPLDIVLKGPLTFTPDGRMHVALQNTADVALSVGITALGLGGAIELRIPRNEMKLTVVGPPLR